MRRRPPIALVRPADGTVVCARCTVAATPHSRLRGLLGLLGRDLTAGTGLLLVPCGAVHMWFMRYAIDVVFLDRAGRVLGVTAPLRPWRCAAHRGAHAVLELPAGTAARIGLACGDGLRGRPRGGGAAGAPVIMPAVSRNVLAITGAIVLVLGPGLETGLGPWLLTSGWAHGRAFPAQGAVTAVGVLLIAGGAAVVLHAFAAFARQGHGTPTPALPTDRLVMSGSYRHVRNPMVLATAVVITGEALVLVRPILLVAAGVYLVSLAIVIRRWEEPALARRFGAPYAAYRRAVRGWWPRRHPWSAPAGDDD